jgi:ABC-type glycerol-3-phosphate transport system substrate-binding protein
MKRNLKGLVVVAMVMTILIQLSSCAGRDTNFSNDNSSDSDKINLNLWCSSIYSNFFNDFVIAFEKENKDIKLNVIIKPETDLYGALDSTLGTKTAPDIFGTLGGIIVPILYRSGHLLNVDDIVTVVEDNLILNAKLNKKDAGGKYYSIPLTGFASPVLFYNQDQFEMMKQSTSLTQQEKDSVKEPETYEELVALCKTIRAYGKEPLTGAFNSWHLPHFMQAMHARTMSRES